MFKLRYNLLALFQLSLGFIIYVFFIKLFGANNKTDAYFLAESMFSAFQLIQFMFVEQFMFFYHDIKNKSKEQAFDFYKFSVFLSFTVGLISVFFLYLLSDLIVNIFNFGLDDERKLFLKEIWNILIIGTLFTLINYVNIKVLNAENRFSVPYIIEAFPSLCVVLTFVYMFVFSVHKIELIAYAKVIGLSLTALFSFYFVWKIGIPVGIKLSHAKAKEFIKNSITMRFGHNIHNFLFIPITNNVLSTLPTGFASYFFYAMKFVQVANSLVVGPQFRVFQSKVSNEWYQNNRNKVLALMRRYVLIVTPVFLIVVLLIYLFLPVFFSILGKTLSVNEVSTVGYLFLSSSLWYTIILIESIFVIISVVSKDSKIFIITNVIFIVVYFILSWTLKDFVGVYAVPLSAIVAQLVNFAFYTKYALKKLNITFLQVFKGGKLYERSS